MVTVSCTYAQSAGIISYTETTKMDIQIDGDHGGIDLSKYLPESTTTHKVLRFDSQTSIYRTNTEENQPEDTELESDDGSFKMTIMHDDGIENILYVSQEDQMSVEQTGFMGKAFLIQTDLPKLKWKVTGEKVKYLDYECMKATTTFEDKDIVAWFTPQISSPIGPHGYGQLPGAILMLSIDEGKTEIMATDVSLSESIEKLEKPTKGKKVTEDEFEKIIEKKMKEIKSQAKGGSTFIIKG